MRHTVQDHFPNPGTPNEYGGAVTDAKQSGPNLAVPKRLKKALTRLCERPQLYLDGDLSRERLVQSRTEFRYPFEGGGD